MSHSTIRLVITLFITAISEKGFSQWISFNASNSPLKTGVSVPYVCSELNGAETFVFAFDTTWHFYGYHQASGWHSYPQFDGVLVPSLQIFDVRMRNGEIWCTTNQGLKKYKAGTWTNYPYPPQVFCVSSGLYIDKDSRVWFAGGIAGAGITIFDGNSWKYIRKNDYSAFFQDNGITDLEMDETTQVMWIGTNCLSAFSGVYAYDVAKDSLWQIPNGGNKYGCVHALLPLENRVFVGTANFSSMRMMENGLYTQTLDAPKARWVTDIQPDPSQPGRVWVLNDVGITLFSDTISYHYFDTVNYSPKGYGYKIATQAFRNDSFFLWIATNSGLYGLKYKNPMNHVSSGEIPVFSPRITVYPNPSGGQFFIRCSEAEITEITITNTLGKTITFNQQDCGRPYTTCISGISPGIYFVYLRGENFQEIRKIEIYGK